MADSTTYLAAADVAQRPTCRCGAAGLQINIIHTPLSRAGAVPCAPMIAMLGLQLGALPGGAVPPLRRFAAYHLTACHRAEVIALLPQSDTLPRR